MYRENCENFMCKDYFRECDTKGKPKMQFEKTETE